jgi:hypothetical protein
MWNLYLDESGDLGFDFVNKEPSKFFVITILAISSQEANRQVINSVKKTLARKLNSKNKRKRLVQELKGTGTTLSVKKYFYTQIKDVKFGVYSVILNKKKLYENLTKDKDRVYNYIARQVIDEIPFERANGTRVNLILDRSKGKPEIEDFNNYIRRQLESRVDPGVPLEIYHWKSHENCGLQACDLFCWGIFQKYERERLEWYGIFAQDKINYERLFLE